MDREKFINEINDTGFTVHRDVFDPNIIQELNEYAQTIPPERGHDKNMKWHGWQECKQLENPVTDVDWAYYWTHQIDHPHLDKIKDA